MNEQDRAGVDSLKHKTSGWQEDLPGMVAFFGVTVAAGIVLIFALAGCATSPEGGSSYGTETEVPSDAGKEVPAGDAGKTETPRRRGESKLGIRTEGLRLSAAGYMLDFRYRVIDPVKAAPLLDKKIRPYLLDDASGAQLAVPDTAKLGQLRTTGRNKVVHGDRDYFILFANPGRFVQAGNKMTLVMGDMRLEDLTVE